MYAAKGTQAYAQIGVESAVMSASQQQLVTMLFDGVLLSLIHISGNELLLQAIAFSYVINELC